MSWLSEGLHKVGNFISGKHDTPNPQHFSQTPTSPSPISLGGSNNQFQGAPPGFNQQQFENSVRTNPDLAGVWQTIQGLGGDVWGTISNFLPKNEDGSIDWGKVGTDVVGWVQKNAQTIIQGAAALENYNRQKKSDEYAQKGLDFIHNDKGTGVYDLNAPLRDAGRAGMLNPTANAPDLSNLKRLATTGSGNPFAGAPMPLNQQAPRSAPPISLTPRAPVTPQMPHPVQTPVTPPLSLQGPTPSPAPTGSMMPPPPATPGDPSQPPISLRTAPARPMTKPMPSPLSLLNPQQPSY